MRALGWLALALSCGGPPVGDPAGGQAGQEGVVLSARSPEAVLPIVVDSARAAPAVVMFLVDRVSNPARRSVAIRVALRVGTDSAIPLGAVALFPVDSGGRFSLRLPAEAVKALERDRPGGRAVSLVATLAADTVAGGDRRALRISGVVLGAAPNVERDR